MCRERALYAKSFYKNDYYLLDRPTCHIPYAYACTIYHMCVSVCVCVLNSIASTGNSFCIFDIECIIDNPSFWPPLLKGTPVEPARSSPCLSFATSFLASFICAHATAYFNSPLSPPSPSLSFSLCPLYRRSTLNSSSSWRVRVCVRVHRVMGNWFWMHCCLLLPPLTLFLSLPWSFGTRRRMPYEWFKCMFCAQKKERKKKNLMKKKLQLRVVALFVSTHLHFVEVISVTFICQNRK